MGSPPSPKSSVVITWLDWVEKYVNTANHMMIGIISVYTIWICWQLGYSANSLHTFLCMIGVSVIHDLVSTSVIRMTDIILIHRILQYQFFMCESIMSLYKHNSWSHLHQRRTQQHLHWILQALGSGAAIAGMAVYYVARDRHLRSTHSQLGFASLIFTCLGILNGTAALWSRELFRFVKPVYTKLFHNVCGITAFVTGMGALILGFQKSSILRNSTPEVVLAMQIGCAVTIVLSLSGALRSFWRLVQGAVPSLFYREEEEDYVPTTQLPSKVGLA